MKELINQVKIKVLKLFCEPHLKPREVACRNQSVSDLCECMAVNYVVFNLHSTNLCCQKSAPWSWVVEMAKLSFDMKVFN